MKKLSHISLFLGISLAMTMAAMDQTAASTCQSTSTAHNSHVAEDTTSVAEYKVLPELCEKLANTIIAFQQENWQKAARASFARLPIAQCDALKVYDDFLREQSSEHHTIVQDFFKAYSNVVMSTKVSIAESSAFSGAIEACIGIANTLRYAHKKQLIRYRTMIKDIVSHIIHNKSKTDWDRSDTWNQLGRLLDVYSHSLGNYTKVDCNYLVMFQGFARAGLMEPLLGELVGGLKKFVKFQEDTYRMQQDYYKKITRLIFYTANKITRNKWERDAAKSLLIKVQVAKLICRGAFRELLRNILSTYQMVLNTIDPADLDILLDLQKSANEGYQDDYERTRFCIVKLIK